MKPEDIVLFQPRHLREWWLYIYPLLVTLGIIASYLIGKTEIEREKEWYWISGRNIVNKWFAYHGIIVWNIVFSLIIVLQLYVCFEHKNGLPLVEREDNVLHQRKRIFKTIAKEYLIKYILIERTLWLCFLFIDHLFVWTGGSCDAGDTYSSEICRRLGGEWKGGFDISGHFCFLTNLSLVLWQEMKEILVHSKVQLISWTRIQRVCQWLVIVVLFIWINVLSITAIYYHTPMEKILGCILGYSSVFVLYFVIPNISSLAKILYKQI